MRTMSGIRKWRELSGRRVGAAVTALAVAGTVLGGTTHADAQAAEAAAVIGQSPSASSAVSVGVQFHGMWGTYTDAQRRQVLDRFRAAGARSVRLDVSWLMLQPDGPGSYYAWGVEFVDRVLGMANERGIKPLVTLWLTPAWANRGQGERVLPDNPADYARMARWAAARWAGKVVGWEVWNEPNSPAFMAGAEPAAYVRLLRAAYPAIKAGSASTPVVFGGLEYNDTDFIRRAYAAGAHGLFDVMATHPYMGIANAGPELADDGTIWTLSHVQAVRDLMVRNGDGHRAIWFTEFGWSTHQNDPSLPAWNRGVTETIQGVYLARAVSLVRTRYPYVTRMYWYNDRDLVAGGIQQQNYGLLRLDLSGKPALAMLATTNAAAAAAAAARTAAGAATT